MKYVEGDLIKMAEEGVFDIIIHGCNCRGIMGAGIAKQIKDSYPEAYEADKKFIRTRMLSDIIGKYSSVRLYSKNKSFFIVNAYTQIDPGANASLELISGVFDILSKDIPKRLKIGIPKIGCGIGGLSWDVVCPIIEGHMINHDITTVNFVPDVVNNTDFFKNL